MWEYNLTLLLYFLVGFAAVGKAAIIHEFSTEWLVRTDCQKYLCHSSFFLNWYLMAIEHMSSKIAGNVKWSLSLMVLATLKVYDNHKMKGDNDLLTRWKVFKWERKNALKRILPFLSSEKNKNEKKSLLPSKQQNVQKIYIELNSSVILKQILENYNNRRVAWGNFTWFHIVLLLSFFFS